MAMRMNGIMMTTVVDRLKLLETLKTNREQHKRIVQEARNGYVKQAQEALTKRLEQLRTGEIISLQFGLSAPLDYTEVYDNSIAMLEWNTDAKVELQADEFRQLVRDEWDWSDTFYGSNSNYSATAMKMSKKK